LYNQHGNTQKSVNVRNIFSFPKGAFAGNCIHEIFENIDFDEFNGESAKKIIGDALAKYNIEDSWQNTIFDMVAKVFTSPVLQDVRDFVLRKVSEDERLTELEFFYPANLISSGGLADIFRKHNINISNKFIKSIDKLGFIPHRGFLKGFIDLVFQYKGKYYIVDWKSNHLGNEINDYSPDKIKAVMEDNYYILQYYIYAVALHRYLLLRKADYDYSRHFGGIIYLFVRGIDPDYPFSGIYNDIPSKDLIDSLNGYFSVKSKHV
jgi:exodeoxyribonuclease V beta subunit